MRWFFLPVFLLVAWWDDAQCRRELALRDEDGPPPARRRGFIDVRLLAGWGVILTAGLLGSLHSPALAIAASLFAAALCFEVLAVVRGSLSGAGSAFADEPVQGPIRPTSAACASVRPGGVARDGESTLHGGADLGAERRSPPAVRLVIIESPYAGDVARNLEYLRAAMRDCLARGEAPYASHALYTQPGVLDDTVPAERTLGIEAGLAWGSLAEATVVYEDLGVSPGMALGIERAALQGRPVEWRRLGGRWERA
jgi:hypothetical protein